MNDTPDPPSPRPEPISYRGGKIRRRNDGWQADIMKKGVRQRKSFPTVAEAKAFIDCALLAAEDHYFQLSAEEIQDARWSIYSLPTEVSLRDAVKFWNLYHFGVNEVLPVPVAVERFLTHRRGLDRVNLLVIQRERKRLEHLAITCPATPVADVTVDQLTEALRRVGDDDELVRTHDVLRDFFAWACRWGFANRSPVKEFDQDLKE